MLDALLTGLISVFQWPAFGFLLLGVMLGIWLGAVPGLGGILGLVILLPFTFGMEPVPAFALLLGMFAVTTTSDTIASVMLGIPGTASSQATILDGYPLAQQGQASRAFGAAFTVSAFGGLFGALVLALSLPLVKPIIFAFGSPEIFMLGILGLAMVGSLSGGSILKGLIVAVLGLWMTTIGYAEIQAVPRYWFGLDYLIDGLPIIPVVLGLFAVPEVMELAIRDVSISRVSKEQEEVGSLFDGVKDAFRNWWLALRCALIGTYIGMLPGLGPSIVDWIAYGHAVQSAKDKSRFGQGDIRGVIAPEAANNAVRGGALIPTLAFGVPGSLGTAILLGALLIQGLKPGPEMLTSNLHITFSIVWTIAIANILVAGLLMIWSKQVAKVAFLPGHLIVPGVIVFVLLGAWLGGGTMGDWVACLTFGILGFVMKRGGWPRPPLILAMVLGDILENAFHLSMRSYQGPSWLGRPIVLIIIALVIITLVFAVLGIIRNKASKSTKVQGEGTEKNPIISPPFTLILGALFVWAGFESLQWDSSTKLFPLVISIAGVALVIPALYLDILDFARALKKAGGFKEAARYASDKALVPRAARFFGYLISIILVTLVLGQKIALPLFVGVYLRRWAKYGWKTTLGYAIGGWAFIIIFYDRVMHLLWHPSWLSDWLPALLPAWFPSWLMV